MTKEKSDILNKLIKCTFSIEELDLIEEALTRLNHSNQEYLTWKKDDYSQNEIPKHIEKIMKLYHKIHKLRI